MLVSRPLQVLLEGRNPGRQWNPDGELRSVVTKATEQSCDVNVVAAGENKDLQGPAGHRLREVRGSFYVILAS